MTKFRILTTVAILAAVFAPMTLAGDVLILGGTVTGGAASLEATSAITAGSGVVVVDDATWAGMSTGDFAAFDALILGDPTCAFATTPNTFSPFF